MSSLSERAKVVSSSVSIYDYFERIVYPLKSDYYSVYGYEFRATRKTLCPLHDENTPSFFCIEDINKYKCFGCGSYGSVIDLHMNLMRKEKGIVLSLEQAIKFLEDTFLKGKDIGRSVYVKDKVKPSMNNITYANSLVTNIERNINKSNEKEDIYVAIDNIMCHIHENPRNDIDIKMEIGALEKINDMLMYGED